MKRKTTTPVTRSAFLAVILVALGGAGQVMATEFGDQAIAMCEKVKQCALDQMGAADMTPQMRQSITPMLENMCVSMQDQFQEVPTDHELYDPAVECMSSMATLSCEDLMEGNAETQQCRDYQELVKKYEQ